MHHRRFSGPSSSRCFGWKRGIKENALGRSRGGFSTKVHALVDTQGRPLHLGLIANSTASVTASRSSFMTSNAFAPSPRGSRNVLDTTYPSFNSFQHCSGLRRKTPWPHDEPLSIARRFDAENGQLFAGLVR